jgi:glycosyltransferase involved in cell wall biosynthesis
MRILFVLHQFYPEFGSGTERVVLNLAHQAQHAGHFVHVLSCAVQPKNIKEAWPSRKVPEALEYVYEGVPITFIPHDGLPAGADISFQVSDIWTSRIQNWLAQETFDIAHIFHLMRMGSALLAIQAQQIPYILTFTDFYPACFHVNLTNNRNQVCAGPDNSARCVQDCCVFPWSESLLRERFQQSQRILSGAAGRYCPSKFVAERYQSIYPDMSFEVIPHGIDMLAMLQSGLKPKVRTESQTLNLGFFGTRIAKKGLLELVIAVREIKNQNVRLDIVGPRHGDPQYHAEVNALIKDDQRITDCGEMQQKDLFAKISNIDLLCLPSLVPETFSLILHEAAAAGIPALVSDLGAPAMFVKHSGGGSVVPAGDIKAWASTIDELARDQTKLQTLRENVALPTRIEEEAFFYESIYHTACFTAV